MTSASRLAELVDSHRRLLRTVDALSNDDMRQPTLLPAWSRDLLVIHLRFGAEAALRGVTSALGGSDGLMYPGGDVQRDREILSGLGQPAEILREGLADACTRLEAAFQDVRADAWDAPVRTRRGPVPISDVLLQRWLDVEVHHVDLDVGYTPGDWPFLLISDFLHVMIEMLPALRSRPDADREINGTWVLRSTSPPDVWAVSAEAGQAWVGGNVLDPVATLTGSGEVVLAVLLGRLPVMALQVSGATDHAMLLKQAFPGP